MAAISTPCGIWQVSRALLAAGKSALIEFTTFPMFHERENKTQLITLARHQFEDGAKSDDGRVSIQKATSKSWIDLGKGVPASSRSQSAA